MRIRLSLSSFAERLRASLFFIPMIAVVGAVLLGLGGLALDEYVNERVTGRLPFGLTSTVESARALLSTIAGATITFAGIAFSVSLLIIQLASSQYSPRVVHTMFRDPFNKRVMALVVGTFTYCVIVLRSVRSSLEEGGDPVIPNLSVMVAVVLGIATILAIVASINHSAHSMDVSEILENIRREATVSIRREWSPAEPGTRPSEPPEPLGRAELRGPLRSRRLGAAARHRRPPPMRSRGGRRAARDPPGTLRHRGNPVLHPLTATRRPRRVRDVCAAVTIGDTRTMQQDVSYGLRQLADVALKALSPGINDPTTAQDSIFHAAAVLAEILRARPSAETAAPHPAGGDSSWPSSRPTTSSSASPSMRRGAPPPVNQRSASTCWKHSTCSAKRSTPPDWATAPGLSSSRPT